MKKAQNEVKETLQLEIVLNSHCQASAWQYEFLAYHAQLTEISPTFFAEYPTPSRHPTQEIVRDVGWNARI